MGGKCGQPYEGNTLCPLAEKKRAAFDKSEQTYKYKTMNMLTIRKAVPDDAENLLKIYAPYVKRTAITFEYDVPAAIEFRGRIAHTLGHYPYLVAVKDGQPVGYAYAGRFKQQPAYQWAVETSIYIDQHHTHQHIGAALHEALEEALRTQGILNMNACIAYTDHQDKYLDDNSIRFHEHMGYRLVAHFHQCGRKFSRWYDIVWMEKLIGPHN